MKKGLLIFFFLTITTAISAQQAAEVTIDEKFSELINSSNNYKGYKVVDAQELQTLQRLTSERIAELKSEIASNKDLAVQQEEKVEKLLGEIETLQANLEALTAEKDAIAFFGIPMNKDSYKALVGTIIGILILALVLFVVRFKRSHVHTQEARKNLSELEKEFEAYRAKSLEKEQRLGRLLQDEKNKQMKMAK